jgi:hypothetical protein
MVKTNRSVWSVMHEAAGAVYWAVNGAASWTVRMDVDEAVGWIVYYTAGDAVCAALNGAVVVDPHPGLQSFLLEIGG